MFGVLLLRFRHEIGCCFAVANASQSHATRALQDRWPQNCKSLIFLSLVSEVTLGPFLVFFCYDLGTKLDAVLPLRMRHIAMQLVRGRLAGNKSEKSQFYQSFNQSLFQFYSRVSEMTLSFFLLFFGYVLGTTLDAVSLLRMRHKAMQLVRGRLAGYKTEKFQIYSKVSEVTLGPFWCFFCYVFGHEIGCYFAVADASQNHAACAWQARW